MTHNGATPPIDIRPADWAIVRRILSRHVPASEVWAFGSRAKRTAKPYSDLDLAVISSEPLRSSITAAMADDFSESDLPWKVDVVDWAGHHERRPQNNNAKALNAGRWPRPTFAHDHPAKPAAAPPQRRRVPRRYSTTLVPR